MGLLENITNAFYNGRASSKIYLNGNIVWGGPVLVSDLILEYNSKNYSGSGTIMIDSSGNNRDGVISNSPTYDGEYFTFIDDYITTPDLNSIIPYTNEVHSVEIWAYPTDDGVLLQYNNTSTPNSNYHFSAMEIVNGNLEIALWSLSGITSTENIGTVSFNEWHQIVLTYDGSVCRGYLDGVYKGSINVIFNSPQEIDGGFYMNFGYRTTTNQGGGSDFNGKFGLMRVYSKKLSDSEVLDNFNNTIFEFIPSIQLLINPNFDLGTTGWTATGGFGTYSFTSSNQAAVSGGTLYFTYVSRTVSQSVNVSSYISEANSFDGILNIRHRQRGDDGGYTQIDTYNFTLLFKNSMGTTIATKTTGTSNAPQNFTDISLTLNRSEIPSTFDLISTVEVQITGIDTGFWNGNHGPMVDYVLLNVS